MEFASRRTSVHPHAAGLAAVLLAAALLPAGCRRRAAPGPVRAAAAAALRGRVVDTAGRAVPDARVLASALADGGPGPPHETVSDGEGRFALHRLTPGRYALVVEATGLLPATPPPVDVPGPEALVRLTGTGRTLAGVVVVG